jgi:hypothetical protein
MVPRARLLQPYPAWVQDDDDDDDPLSCLAAGCAFCLTSFRIHSLGACCCMGRFDSWKLEISITLLGELGGPNTMAGRAIVAADPAVWMDAADANTC